jgi:hypothetical protein
VRLCICVLERTLADVCQPTQRKASLLFRNVRQSPHRPSPANASHLLPLPPPSSTSPVSHFRLPDLRRRAADVELQSGRSSAMPLRTARRLPRARRSRQSPRPKSRRRRCSRSVTMLECQALTRTLFALLASYGMTVWRSASRLLIWLMFRRARSWHCR